MTLHQLYRLLIISSKETTITYELERRTAGPRTGFEPRTS